MSSLVLEDSPVLVMYPFAFSVETVTPPLSNVYVSLLP